VILSSDEQELIKRRSLFVNLYRNDKIHRKRCQATEEYN